MKRSVGMQLTGSMWIILAPISQSSKNVYLHVIQHGSSTSANKLHKVRKSDNHWVLSVKFRRTLQPTGDGRQYIYNRQSVHWSQIFDKNYTSAEEEEGEWNIFSFAVSLAWSLIVILHEQHHSTIGENQCRRLEKDRFTGVGIFRSGKKSI